MRQLTRLWRRSSFFRDVVRTVFLGACLVVLYCSSMVILGIIEGRI